jgi:hypothetical protein
MEARMETKAPDNKPTSAMCGCMFLFMIGFTFGVWLLNLLAIVQFVWLLIAREPSQFIARFGSSLSLWLAEIGRFLTSATDDRPFPWRQWPDATSLPRQITSSGS